MSESLYASREPLSPARSQLDSAGSTESDWLAACRPDDGELGRRSRCADDFTEICRDRCRKQRPADRKFQWAHLRIIDEGHQ
jgi:hypothetical protein